MTEQEALVALNLIPDVGSIRLKNLLEAFGSAPKIFLNPESTLKKVDKIGDKIAKAIARFSSESLKKELELAKKLKVEIITLKDKKYPENLKEIYDPPLCLYVKGRLFPEDKLALAVVGSRRASLYGLACAEKFSYSLANLGITIVSGLARGVDTQAHKGALKARGRTLAVLGSGLNNMYPPENKNLAESIAERAAVISEFPLDTAPLARNFPRRNRVISGLSLGTIVVEAAKNSGALITADFALEQGRDVFAIPGKVDSATSIGTNRLIKQGAKLIDSVEDILEELKVKIKEFIPEKKPDLEITGEGNTKKKEPSFALSQDESLVYNILCDTPCYVDEIIEKTQLPSAKVMSLLFTLEMKKMIKQLPGKMFIRK